jgi:hypothetical protein
MDFRFPIKSLYGQILRFIELSIFEFDIRISEVHYNILLYLPDLYIS